ncbi:MAG: cytochrome c oxidase accessory protein CcoG [Gammaproteobacteria bacterium]|jgi:cytochrome c oxidase accessory protein FixG|nr:cytochrome c oxidase accessory protein CcoG [Gammaproteobacteria bacterium]MBT4491899.1 cytochrome c oxidase accessory protein CcoG [Gammaproteobacteria bacterium]MBT7370495.1 cytochrome c oxidase accessory protein CcoG [Gammaproteobacteria bacterium]
MDSKLPEGADSSVLNLYEKREKIYVRSMEGFYQNIRLFTGWPLLIGFFGCPWLLIDGHQSVLFDLPERKFHIFWLTFWPQDFALLGWCLMIAAFLLFFMTNLTGRVWCGYTCPQTVWTAIFMWAEQTAEGERHQRIRLDRQPWNIEKLWRRSLKHAMWFGFAFLTGLTFVSYFYGIYDLIVDAYHLQVPAVAIFWILFFSAATYINAGWMREQVCTYMCPYARFQSAMFDNDTLIVSYDQERGDPRGSRKRGQSSSKGDCIDCDMCVQVCPTGIDIRDGLQYQCINCALCVDACNSVMDKMGYESGLVRYTTLNQLAGHPWSWKRPKLIGYGMAILVMIVAVSAVILTRVPLEVDVLRGRGKLFQEVPGGYVQNTYTLKLINMDKVDHHYSIAVSGLSDYKMVPRAPVPVEAGEIGEISVNLIVDPDQLAQVNTPIKFEVRPGDGRFSANSKSTFIGPRLIK